jgi:hypothetical protein
MTDAPNHLQVARFAGDRVRGISLIRFIASTIRYGSNDMFLAQIHLGKQ